MNFIFDRHARADAGAAGRFGAVVALIALAVCAASVHAAAINVTVIGSDGKPLEDAVALLDAPGARPPVKPMADVEISQAKRRFSPRVTLITVGTKTTFPNFDTVRHHVYSFSSAKPFELKLYAGVPNAPITFDKPGVVVLGCNIHDSMAAWVVVADTPWFARSAANGVARVEAVPAGSYQLRVWHPGLVAEAPLVPIAVTVGHADLEQKVRLAVIAEP